MNHLEGWRKVLVCRTDAIGDTLLTLPVCTALKRALPQVRITFLVSNYTLDLVRNHPDVDEVMVMPAAKTAGNRAWQRNLRQAKFDAALAVFPDKRVAWALWRAGIPVRVGSARRWWSFLFSHRISHSRKKAQRHEADYNLDLVRALGVSPVLEPPRLAVAPEDRAWAETFLQQRRPTGLSGDWVLVHPGSHGSSANWPVDSYRALVQRLQAAGYPVLLTGSPAEKILLQQVAKGCQPQPAMLEQPVSLTQLAALIACSRVFVAGNTGPLHIAAALQVPVLTFFPGRGVTGPVRWSPLTERKAVLLPPKNEPGAVEKISLAETLAALAQWLPAMKER